MKIYSTVCLMWIYSAVLCQNLVLNPGFDTLLACPDAPSQIEYALYWSSATNGTPDLYNECADDPRLKVPHCGYNYEGGYQKQRSGSGFAGVFAYSNAGVDIEYLEGQLSRPMEKGRTYFVEFFVSPDVDTIGPWSFTDAIGLAFSHTYYYTELLPFQVAPFLPVIENRGTIITDTTGWTRISGCYVATGGESYCIIGNFRTESETMVVVSDPDSYPHRSIFFIEDVGVYLFDPLPDTILLCPGEHNSLNAGFLDGTYLWNTGESDSIIIIDAPGEYTVEVFMSNCVLRDTVMILQVDEGASFPQEIYICSDEGLVLEVPVFGEYEWSTGVNSPAVTIHEEGTYSVTVENICGLYVFETEVFSEECGCRWYIPNVMSPNQDGINDELEVNLFCDFPFSIISFEVYDRWGNKIHASHNEAHHVWNGTSKDGRTAPPGVYVWKISYSTTRHGVEEVKYVNGDITLLY